MKALVYDGPGQKSWRDVPDPVILHPTDVGSSVSSLRRGDRVITSCIKSCGHCGNCRNGLFSHCLGNEGQAGTGWILGHLIDGTQAESVRVPYAENGSTHTVNPSNPEWIADVLALTDGAGVDVAMEAVGVPETFDMALRLVRPGGHVANIGVHGKPVELPLQDLWIQNINISMGLVNTNTTPMLLRLVAQHKLPADKFATHHFGLEQIMDAYDTFSRAAETGALKVVLSRNPHD
ncbi:zinc-binding dehydrogenase [Paenarthrobacter aurescens]|uniref:zinc-binding dehydrogenase n=1 Tax=Paenarthrobacter aurescens TaxID=43663 RepID=UPI0035EDED77